ncbi:MAG: MFS transporter [Verrucomicrobiota bacterium]
MSAEVNETEPGSDSGGSAAAEEQPDWKSMRGVIGVQIQNTLNDKITQFMLIGLGGAIAGRMPLSERDTWAFKLLDDYDLFVSLLISIPFVVFGPIAGWFSDHCSKKTVLRTALIIQSFVLAWIATGLILQMVVWTTFGFFLLAIQSAMLGPARVGICKDLVGSKKLAAVTGITQMVSIVGMITGTVIGGRAFSYLSRVLREETGASAQSMEPSWNAAAIIIGILFVLSVIPFLVLMIVKKTPAHPEVKFHRSLWWIHFHHMSDLFRERRMGLAAGTVTFFWFTAGVMALVIIQAGKEVFPAGNERAIEASSYINGVLGVGVAAGSIFMTQLCRECNRVGLSPIGAGGIGLSLAVLSTLATNSVPYYIGVFSMGFFGGIFLVPLSTLVQDLAAEERRGRVISAMSLLSALALLGSVGFAKLLRQFGFGSHSQYLILGILAILAVIPTLILTKQHSRVQRIDPANA